MTMVSLLIYGWRLLTVLQVVGHGMDHGWRVAREHWLLSNICLAVHNYGGGLHAPLYLSWMMS